MKNSNIYEIKMKIIKNFNSADWLEIGLITGYGDYIDYHPRLLKSLSFGDSDYPSCVTDVLNRINRKSPDKLSLIYDYVYSNYPDENSEYISNSLSNKKITFAPSVFTIPKVDIKNNLVSVMMPFRANFDSVFEGIKRACSSVGFDCLRADDIWNNSTIIQDIFELIYKSKIVIVDFSTRNPNVMYETGIAHTLGKTVIPISQNIDDVPFDMKHHRVLNYLINEQGINEMIDKLEKKLIQYK